MSALSYENHSNSELNLRLTSKIFIYNKFQQNVSEVLISSLVFVITPKKFEG